MKIDRRTLPKKQNAPKTSSLEKVLAGIRNKKYYFDVLENRYNLSWVKVHVNVVPEVNLEKPFELQRIKFESRKRGNIKPFAGKNCEVIVASKRTKGPNVYLYLRESK